MVISPVLELEACAAVSGTFCKNIFFVRVCPCVRVCMHACMHPCVGTLKDQESWILWSLTHSYKSLYIRCWELNSVSSESEQMLLILSHVYNIITSIFRGLQGSNSDLHSCKINISVRDSSWSCFLSLVTIYFINVDYNFYHLAQGKFNLGMDFSRKQTNKQANKCFNYLFIIGPFIF